MDISPSSGVLGGAREMQRQSGQGPILKEPLLTLAERKREEMEDWNLNPDSEMQIFLRGEIPWIL